MKKMFLMALMAVMTLTVSAQLITSNRTVRGDKAHNVWIDFGAGFGTQSGSKGANFDLDLRFNKMFHENVGWDILKIGASTNTEDFGKSIWLKALTGIRGESPVLFGNAKAYANFAGGYGYHIDAEKGGFTWEVGAGLKLTPRFNIGIAYESITINSNTSGSIGLLLGLAL